MYLKILIRANQFKVNLLCLRSKHTVKFQRHLEPNKNSGKTGSIDLTGRSGKNSSIWQESITMNLSGMFDVWNQTFTDGDTGKISFFYSFFPHVLEIAQPDYTWRDSSVIGIIRALSKD